MSQRNAKNDSKAFALSSPKRVAIIKKGKPQRSMLRYQKFSIGDIMFEIPSDIKIKLLI